MSCKITATPTVVKPWTCGSTQCRPGQALIERRWFSKSLQTLQGCSRSERRSIGVVNLFKFGKSGQASGKAKSCPKCSGKGSLTCPGCKNEACARIPQGSGKNKANGNVFERWKCFDCQGFGLVDCPKCGGGGLTPEQRGER